MTGRAVARARRGAAALVASLVVGVVAVGVTPAAYAANGPGLTGLSIIGDPFTADITHGSTAVGVLLQTTDDAGGIADASVIATCTSLCSGTGAASVQNDGVDFTGSPLTQEGTVSLTIPQTAQSGNWQVTEVDLSDASGNPAAVTGATLGTHTAFTVSKQPDSTPPALVGITVPGGNVDVTTADHPIALSVHATDNVAGVASGAGPETPGRLPDRPGNYAMILA